MQMILSTIKKVTVIYLLISSLLFSLVSLQSFASEELASFCFKSATSLSEARQSLEFLLLPREKIFLRKNDNCFDVNTSTDRSNLLEKFLSKRYTLIAERGPEMTSMSNCHMEFKTTRKKKVNTTGASIGATNSAATATIEQNESSTSKLLLGLGKPGVLDLEGRSLQMICSGGLRGIYQLVFYYSEEMRSKVSTEVTAKQGEVVNIGGIVNDLNTKSKTLGLPESIYNTTSETENISYELMIN